MPANVLVDAGPLIGLLRKTDSHHARAVEFVKRFTGRLITSWPVLAEASHFLNEHGRLALLAMLRRGALDVEELHRLDLERIEEFLRKYRGSDLADASIIVLAERFGVTDVITVDRTDFGIYRTRSGRVFVNHF